MSSETTHLEDIGVHVCDNCGAHSDEIKTITHYDSCTPGEAKKWEKYYNDTNNA